MMESRQEWLEQVRKARRSFPLTSEKAEVRPAYTYFDKVSGRYLDLREIDSHTSENPGESYVIFRIFEEWNNGDKLKYEEYLEVEENIEELFKPLDYRVRFE